MDKEITKAIINRLHLTEYDGRRQCKAVKPGEMFEVSNYELELLAAEIVTICGQHLKPHLDLVNRIFDR